jgi:membrane protein implicated in regulation of membrane protease activity
MTAQFPPQAWFLAVCSGVGFGYATLGVIHITLGQVWGRRLWWLELLLVLAATAVVLWLFRRTLTHQGRRPRSDQGQRAIMRLVYRRGNVLSITEIAAETLLDEGNALATLHQMRERGQAEPLANGLWRVS